MRGGFAALEGRKGLELVGHFDLRQSRTSQDPRVPPLRRMCPEVRSLTKTRSIVRVVTLARFAIFAADILASPRRHSRTRCSRSVSPETRLPTLPTELPTLPTGLPTLPTDVTPSCVTLTPRRLKLMATVLPPIVIRGAGTPAFAQRAKIRGNPVPHFSIIPIL